MNLFYSLPNDIINHIFSFLKIHYSNFIILHWRRYYHYKKFIINSIYNLPKFNSIINNHLIFSVISKKTFLLFKKLFTIITGNESYFNQIYNAFYTLAISIDDYEWASSYNNYYYSYNKYYCISTAFKYNWNNILIILQ